MNSVKSFDLGEHFGAFVEDQVERGNFDDADSVVRAGLALLERASIGEDSRIRAAIAEGEASGGFGELDWNALYAEIEAEEADTSSSRTG